jgi:hypothetical protein
MNNQQTGTTNSTTNLIPPGNESEYWRDYVQQLGMISIGGGLGHLQWRVMNGAPALTPIALPTLGPAGCLASNLLRSQLTSETVAAASGTIFLDAFLLPFGMNISNVNVMIGSTAGATINHYWGIICDSTGVPVATGADGTGTSLTAKTVYSFAITAGAGGTITSYTTQYTGIHYCGFMVSNNSGTQPTFMGTTAMADVSIPTVPPVTHATGGGSNTTPIAIPGASALTLTPAVANQWIFLT